jgi:hypothetical protein
MFQDLECVMSRVRFEPWSESDRRDTEMTVTEIMLRGRERTLLREIMAAMERYRAEEALSLQLAARIRDERAAREARGVPE